MNCCRYKRNSINPCTETFWALKSNKQTSFELTVTWPIKRKCWTGLIFKHIKTTRSKTTAWSRVLTVKTRLTSLPQRNLYLKEETDLKRKKSGLASMGFTEAQISMDRTLSQTASPSNREKWKSWPVVTGTKVKSIFQRQLCPNQRLPK